ncbi:nascent polypeptide-associated complex subunit alpha, muscle-specific form-like [Dermacentor silvarum]|uniref:nascent polypeptide-associated complex subunit alpha, muscle-specific form-like n=1 Tax=Dermacentor silvarum TaxID=543639 RepID=UPI002100BF49|nr:nascent polypeptide-associated complex subunit alpha, muscle-specific form-like [Dermacentor silvarum]
MKYIKATTVPQEIQVWFQGELESRGIDTVYSHTVMSLLLHPEKELGNRVAAVECLRSATEQKAGLETLVDELCRRLNNHLNPESEAEEAAAAAPVEEPLKRRSPKELAQMYYAAFPALDNSPQVQAQRVSWDGRRIIELHEREQQSAEGANWELMQEQQLRSKLDSPSLVAIWGRQTSAAIGAAAFLRVKKTHIFDGFNSVWALSGEDKVMLKVLSRTSCEGEEPVCAERRGAVGPRLGFSSFQVQEDEEAIKKEKADEDEASGNIEPGSLAIALAKIVAKLLEKHNCATALFKDDVLFWNWAKDGSDEPLLRAIGNATQTVFSETKHSMSKSALLNAGQGDCLTKYPLDINFSSHWPGKDPLMEHPMHFASGEIAGRPCISGSHDYLAMGDFTTAPADDSDDFWERGFDPTEQFGFLDSDEDDIVAAEEPVVKCPTPWPSTSTSSGSDSPATWATCSAHSSSSFLEKKAKVEATVPISEPEQNSVKEKINTPGDTWHPTWIEDLLRVCPDAEVDPIFADISRKVANSAKETGARPKERRNDSSAGKSGSSDDSNTNLGGNKHKGSSKQQEGSAADESSQDELASTEWPWTLDSNGELTTIGPWSPLRAGSQPPPPAVRSAYIEALRKELEAEIDELLYNLYELAQPWFQENSAGACGENKEIWPLQQPGMPFPSYQGSFLPQPNLGLALPSIAASMPDGFSPADQPLSAAIRPPGFYVPSVPYKPQAPRQNPSALNAHSNASGHNNLEPSRYANKYSAPDGTADAKPLSSTSASFTKPFLAADTASHSSVPTALSHVPSVNTAGLGTIEEIAQGVGPAHISEQSGSDTGLANSVALATKIPVAMGAENSGASGAFETNPQETSLTNCSAQVSIATIHDSAVPSTIMKGGPSSTTPDSNAVKELKTSLPTTSSLQSIHTYTASPHAPGCSNSSTSQSFTVPNCTTQADCTASPAFTGNTQNSQVPWTHTSQPYTSESSSSQSCSLPQSVSLPNCSLASNSQGTTTDATTSEGSSKSSTNISNKPFHNVPHSYTSDRSVAQTLPPELSQAEAGAPSGASLTNSSPSSKLPSNTAMSGSSTCVTSVSNPLLHNTTVTATFTNCSAPPPLLSTSFGNISYGAIPWTFPWPPSHPGHEALSRPPAWHQHGPTPWATHGPRAGPINCNLPGNGTLAGHIRVSPPPNTRPPPCTLVNPHHIRLGPGPVPRPPWPTSWTPPWPGHGQLSWPLSTWPLPPPENRSPQEHASRPLARPMQCALPPAPWTHLRMRTPVMPPPNTQPTSVCGIVASPSFGQMLQPPPHRPPIAAGICSYQGQALAGAKTPPKPVADSLIGPWHRPPPPTPSAGAATLCPAAPQPGLLNATSSANDVPTTSITASPSLPVVSEPPAVHVTSSPAGPASRHMAVSAPRHAPKVPQGRCFKPPVGASPKITSMTPPSRLPPRLAPRLAAKLAMRPSATSNCGNGSETSESCPETERPVSQPCKDASQVVPETASRQPIKPSKEPSQIVPEITSRQPAKPCRDTSKTVSEVTSRQPVAADPMDCDRKAQTNTECSGRSAKGGSSSCNTSTGQGMAWRKAPNFKSSSGVSSHSMHNSEQNMTASALPEKRRQETYSTAPPYSSSGRRKKRR